MGALTPRPLDCVMVLETAGNAEIGKQFGKQFESFSSNLT